MSEGRPSCPHTLMLSTAVSLTFCPISSLPRFLRVIRTTHSKPPNHGSWCHLLRFPASSVLLLSPRPHVCYFHVFTRDYTLWFAIYHLLVRGFSCVFPPSDLSLTLNCNVIEGGDALTSEQRGAFIGGAIIETLPLLISIVGYILHVSILHPY